MLQARAAAASNFVSFPPRFRPVPITSRERVMQRRVASTWPPNVTVLASCAAVLWLLASCGGHARGAVATVPASSSSSPLAVLLTTDCGVEIDDQWALAHILVS